MLVAQIAIFLERAVDDVFELGGKPGIETHRGRGCAVQDLVENDSRSLAAKWNHSRRHFVEDDAEGEQIGAGIERLAPHLFGRHIGYRA
jgi:hypothetical protein